MQQVIAKHTSQVTATIGAATAGRTFTFDDDPMLSKNNIIVYGIQAFTAAWTAATEGGATVIADADKVNIAVTLVDNNNYAFVDEQPVSDLIRGDNGGFIFPIVPRVLNLTSCYIRVLAAGSLSANEVVAFTLYYDFLKK